MPVVEVHILEGYDDTQKQRLGGALTDAVLRVMPAAPEAITILIHELPNSAYMRGGQTRTPAPARPDAVELVREYLGALEGRDLPKAKTFLGQEFQMRFPGAAPMQTLEQLIDWAKPRYRFVTKSYDGFDQAQSGVISIVYCHGTLAGEWPDGTPFANIRFIDRFEVTGGLITHQDVWNDIAETKALP
ncbi:MAG: 4-oxalocrotonate tautomerase family enzyme [Paracoccaceae bacterium]|jgi:4-oxalocrotonate tautomerase family enzyme